MMDYLKLNLIITQFHLAHTQDKYYSNSLIKIIVTDSSLYFVEAVIFADCSNASSIKDCEIKLLDKLNLIKTKKEFWSKNFYDDFSDVLKYTIIHQNPLITGQDNKRKFSFKVEEKNYSFDVELKENQLVLADLNGLETINSIDSFYFLKLLANGKVEKPNHFWKLLMITMVIIGILGGVYFYENNYVRSKIE